MSELSKFYQEPEMADLFKRQMLACDNVDQRKALFWIWAMDMTFPRGDICLALKEMNLANDMEFIS